MLANYPALSTDERRVQFMGPKILLIDDNRLNRDVLGVLLRKLGIEYVMLESPLNLQQLLNEIDHLEAVFLDLEMPVMNGYEGLAVLKAHPVTQDTPVVAYTVHVSQVNQAKQAGFDSFLSKPIDSNRFPEYLERILNGQAVWEL